MCRYSPVRYTCNHTDLKASRAWCQAMHQHNPRDPNDGDDAEPPIVWECNQASYDNHTRTSRLQCPSCHERWLNEFHATWKAWWDHMEAAVRHATANFEVLDLARELRRKTATQFGVFYDYEKRDTAEGRASIYEDVPHWMELKQQEVGKALADMVFRSGGSDGVWAWYWLAYS